VSTNYKLIASVGKEMTIANRIVAAFQLTLVVAFAIWLAAGDSSINNLSSADVLIDGTVLASSSFWCMLNSRMGFNLWHTRMLEKSQAALLASTAMV
jgi:hypothetical protein